MKKFNENQSGRSMIEMLGVLAIVGVLSVAGIAGYSKAMAKYKINKVMDEVSTIAANTKTMFASSGLYSELTGLQVAYELAILPEEMTKSCDNGTTTSNNQTTSNWSDACVINGLGGSVDLKTTADGLSFYLMMSGLTQEACVALVTSDWGGSSGFKYLKAANAAQTTALTHAAESGATGVVKPTDNAEAAFNVAVTSGVCNCTGSTCSVGFVFY
jgi:Tfp pilus assembly protein PilE